MKTTSTEVTFSCGHVQYEADCASVADPAGLLADLKLYRTDPGLCALCKEPEKYKAILEWRSK